MVLKSLFSITQPIMMNIYVGNKCATNVHDDSIRHFPMPHNNILLSIAWGLVLLSIKNYGISLFYLGIEIIIKRYIYALSCVL